MMHRQTGGVLILALLVTALLTAVVAGIGLSTSYRLHAAQSNKTLQSMKSDQEKMYANAMTQLVSRQLQLPYHDLESVDDRQTALWVQATPHGVLCQEMLTDHHEKSVKQNHSFLISMLSQRGDVYYSSQQCVRFQGQKGSWHWSVRWYHRGLDESIKEEI